MQELSMNVLDVAENSVAAGATLVAITLSIDTAAKRMTLTITDNGKGMPPETSFIGFSLLLSVNSLQK